MEQQMQNYIEAGINEADRCYTRILELEEQNALDAALHETPHCAEAAAGMALIGMYWLENNAPEKLTELHREIRAQAVIDALSACGEFATVVTDFHTDRHERVEICFASEIKQYAANIRQG